MLEAEKRFVDLLARIDVVSFDFFDTLVGRPDLLSPRDVFTAVQDRAERDLGDAGKRFPLLRARAEEAARVRAWGFGFQEVTLEEIYAELAPWTGWSGDRIGQVRDMELEAERDAVRARDTGRRLYRLALAAGKRIMLLTDTYLPESFIAELAEREGYGGITRIYASSSERRSKLRGSLFDVLVGELGCDPARVLHVGDDATSDVVPALSRGLNALHVPTMVKTWRTRHGIGDRCTGSALMSAMLSRIAETAERPQRRSDRQNVLADIGERSMAPLLLGFSTWLVDRLRAGGYGRVFFASRDGLILKQAFDVVAEAANLEVDTRYLYVSRAALYPTLVLTAPEIARHLFSATWDRMSIEAALQRLGLRSECCLEVLTRHDLLGEDLSLTPRTLPRFRRALEELWPLVEAANAAHTPLVTEYLRGEGFLDRERDAFVDIGWHGTSQDCLTRLCRRAGVAKVLDGYYLGTFDTPLGTSKDLRTSGYLVDGGMPTSVGRIVRSSPSLLELLHGAPHGQVVGYERLGSVVAPVLEDSPWERRQFRHVVEPIQRFAMAALTRHLDTRGAAPFRSPDPEVVARAALRFLHDPTAAEASVLGRLKVVTDLGGSPKSVTGVEEWDLARLQARRLPDGTIPMWSLGLAAMRRSAAQHAVIDEAETPTSRPYCSYTAAYRRSSTAEPEPDKPVLVSIVVPARDAAGTVADALESLVSQTLSEWEAIVVDDGSTDDTAEVVARLAKTDSRIHLARHTRGRGTGAARNTGLGLARGEWLVFLDADDELAPDHLERMLAGATPEVDVAYCPWARLAPDGTVGPEYPPLGPFDAFETLGRHCPFAVHSCLVRRSAIDAVGGFDTSLEACEDWDLWQRVARSGARFREVPGVVALYRTRPGSASHDVAGFLAAGLRVIHRASRPDPRIRRPHPAYAHGLPPDGLASRKLLLATWCAGLDIGKGTEGAVVLHPLGNAACPDLSPSRVADNLFDSIPISAGTGPGGWWELAPLVWAAVEDFLIELEALSGAARLVQRALVVLERRILEHVSGVKPLTVGSTYSIAVDLDRPIDDVAPPPGLRRLNCRLISEGERLGTVELPISRAVVPAAVIADAVAADHCWLLLATFLRRAGGGGRHDSPGWETFLQELWARPGWPVERFYDPSWAEPAAAPPVPAGEMGVELEVGEDLPDVATTQSALIVVPTVGGARVGTVEVAVEGPVVRAQAIRAAITGATGMELARAVARAVVGTGMGTGIGYQRPLRQRLRQAAAHPTWAEVRSRRPNGPGWSHDRQARSPHDEQRLLILRYHQVARRDRADGKLCVTPEAFAEQIELLHDLGFRSTTLREWRCTASGVTLPGQPVLLRFDGPGRSFAEEAWPILQRLDFSATVFLPSDRVGKDNGGEEPVLSWANIRQLHREGVEFGALSATGEPLGGAAPLDVTLEAARSRAALTRELGSRVDAFAYPHGDADRVIQHIVGACGFTFGLTTRPGHASPMDDLLALPCIEISALDCLEDFASKIGAGLGGSAP
ncbi:MAG: glycosyltransferase [Acidimicrobiia bacterium]